MGQEKSQAAVFPFFKKIMAADVFCMSHHGFAGKALPDHLLHLLLYGIQGEGVLDRCQIR